MRRLGLIRDFAGGGLLFSACLSESGLALAERMGKI